MKKITMLTLLAGPDRTVPIGATAEFPDDEAAELVDGGYAVYAQEGERQDSAPAPTLPAGPQPPQSKPLEAMTSNELKAYAEANDIDLGAAKRRDDVLAAIRAAETGD